AEPARQPGLDVRRRLRHRRSEGQRCAGNRPIPQLRVRGPCAVEPAGPAGLRVRISPARDALSVGGLPRQPPEPRGWVQVLGRRPERYSRSGGLSCFSRLRYAFLERWTLWEGVFNRSLTGAFGFGTRTTTFCFSRLRLTTRRARESVARGGA